MQQKHIESIIQANNDNRLAIFVGAGITKNCETDTVKVPLWADLIEEMKNDLSTEESDFLKIAELYFLEFGEFTYFEKLKAFFATKLKPTEIHKKIFELNPDVVITTNWDDVLETTIDENAHIYDVIRSDKDLVKSTLQKKLIKMHGDFTADNLVFKESDYLNYSNHFPIIENYVRSILSTHTVLFLGYSYSDYNLKQIMKWLQHHSDIQPPRYLTQFSDNKNQTKYLSAHGITTLTLGNDEGYSERLLSFLKALHNSSHDNLVNYLDKPEQFILKRLSIFAGLDRILFEQIRKALTNCYFHYDNDEVILQLYVDDEMSFDHNEVIRKIYKGFIKYLTEVNDYEKGISTETEQIFDILSRANIKGIAISQEENGIKYVPIAQNPRAESKYFNFESPSKALVISSDESTWNLMHQAFTYYQQQEYRQAYQITEEIILKKSRKERAYVCLFIAINNRNNLLKCLKLDLFIQDELVNVKQYNLEEAYFNLPRDIREIVNPVYEFGSSSFLNRLSFESSIDLKKTEQSSQTKQRGGLSVRADAHKTACLQNNLLCFVFANTIMLEEYQEFKHFNQQAFEIALMKQAHLNEFSLTKVELFSAIKFLKFENLTDILVRQY